MIHRLMLSHGDVITIAAVGVACLSIAFALHVVKIVRSLQVHPHEYEDWIEKTTGHHMVDLYNNKHITDLGGRVLFDGAKRYILLWLPVDSGWEPALNQLRTISREQWWPQVQAKFDKGFTQNNWDSHDEFWKNPR